MAKESLLAIVQGILSDTDGDEVNSITDTIESEQCARVVRDEYWRIIDNMDIKMDESIQRLDATSALTPVKMTKDTKVHSIETVWYDTRVTASDPQSYTEITFLESEEFLKMAFSLRTSDTNVDTLEISQDATLTLNLPFRNDKQPQYWTILKGYDDIYFDSYDSAVEANLQNSKSLIRCVYRPTFALSDGTIPDLPENLFVLLKDKARSMYFDLYKDGAPQAVARRERQSEVRSQRKKYITKNLQEKRTGPNYGRK